MRMILLAAALVTLLAGPVLGEAQIRMELATQPGFPATGSHKWYKLLTDLGVDGLRIRGLRAGDEVTIIQRGTEARPSYDVLGILTAGDELVLKGGRFSSRDIGELKKFLDDLRSEGIEEVTTEKGAFGITNSQLIAAVEDLTPPVRFATEALPLGQLLEQAQRRIELPIVVEPAARAALAQAGECRDELQGVSLGTAMAVALGAEGLVLLPNKVRGGELQLVITRPRAEGEAWPMGWPPQGAERELAPALFEFLSVEISGIALPKALDAVKQRLKIPFLFDRHSLAQQAIVMDEIKVSVPAGRSYYKRVLDRMLFQARLQGELRVDEAGSPFYWITTIKQP